MNQVSIYKMRLYSSNILSRRVLIESRVYLIDDYLHKIRLYYFISRVAMYIVMFLVVMIFSDDFFATSALIITFVLFMVLSVVHYAVCMKLTPNTILQHFEEVKK